MNLHQYCYMSICNFYKMFGDDTPALYGVVVLSTSQTLLIMGVLFLLETHTSFAGYSRLTGRIGAIILLLMNWLATRKYNVHDLNHKFAALSKTNRRTLRISCWAFHLFAIALFVFALQSGR